MTIMRYTTYFRYKDGSERPSGSTSCFELAQRLAHSTMLVNGNEIESFRIVQDEDISPQKTICALKNEISSLNWMVKDKSEALDKLELKHAADQGMIKILEVELSELRIQLAQAIARANAAENRICGLEEKLREHTMVHAISSEINKECWDVSLKTAWKSFRDWRVHGRSVRLGAKHDARTTCGKPLFSYDQTEPLRPFDFTVKRVCPFERGDREKNVFEITHIHSGEDYLELPLLDSMIGSVIATKGTRLTRRYIRFLRTKYKIFGASHK